MDAKGPRILLIDIETVPGIGYVWNQRDKFMPIERLKEPGRAVCAAYQWLGETEVHFAAEWKEGGRKAFLTEVRDALMAADAVVTYNGEGFDFPVMLGEFLVENILPPGPLTSIDLYKVISKMRFFSGKLAYIAPLLKIGAKVKHEGFSLWPKVMARDPKALEKMERYNKQDTRLLARGYKRMRPFIYNHPYIRVPQEKACSVCGSHHLQHRGARYTKSYRIERFQCMKCGSWPPIGKRTKRAK